MIFERALKINENYYGKGKDFYLSLGGDFTDLVESGLYDMSNACAAKLSEALRLSGIEIPNGGSNTVKGDNGYYYASAKKMIRFFNSHISIGKSVGRNYKSIRIGLVYQSGFSNVSGHVDVVYNYKAAGTFYNRNLNGNLYNVPKTVVWK